MFGKENRGEAGVTLVATNCELVGDIHFNDQLLINGIVKGNIYSQSGSKATVTISEKGRVRGEIQVPNVVVNGKVFGDIKSDRHVELAAKAEVKGNVYYNLIEMVMGSRVDGQLVNMRDVKKSAKAVEGKTGAKSDEAVSEKSETINTPQVAAVSSTVK
jgi:cytoskeletal protein CcmA (bactofilin family)